MAPGTQLPLSPDAMLDEGAGSELFMVTEQRHPQIKTLFKHIRGHAR